MERHLQTIFCDDIRHELGGKLSYIGVYSGRLIVPDFPVTLPKLCVAVCALTSAERPFGNLVLRVLKDDDVVTEGVLDESQLSTAFEVPVGEASAAAERVLALQALFVFSPFHLATPCLLRVQAQTVEGELHGPALMVESAREG
jgi:hypothetical protein